MCVANAVTPVTPFQNFETPFAREINRGFQQAYIARSVTLKACSIKTAYTEDCSLRWKSRQGNYRHACAEAAGRKRRRMNDLADRVGICLPHRGTTATSKDASLIAGIRLLLAPADKLTV
jgi:hypothetical protein